MPFMTELGVLLLDLVNDSSAEENLRTYFSEPEQTHGGVVFSGRNFERLGVAIKRPLPTA